MVSKLFYWKRSVQFFVAVVLFALIISVTSCENNREKSKLTAVENVACAVILNNAFSSFLTAITEGKINYFLTENLEINYLDTQKGSAYHVINYNFHSGTECKDGYRRSGIWQVQFNKYNLRDADTILLFLQRFNLDSINLNSGVGWKGQQLSASGVIKLIKSTPYASTTTISVSWQSKNFVSLNDLIVSRTIKSESNNIIEYDLEVSGTSRLIAEQSINVVLSSQELTHRDNCWKAVESGIITITDQSIDKQKYFINFNPFGSTTENCDEHAKLEFNRIEKMFTLW